MVIYQNLYQTPASFPSEVFATSYGSELLPNPESGRRAVGRSVMMMMMMVLLVMMRLTRSVKQERLVQDRRLVAYLSSPPWTTIV